MARIAIADGIKMMACTPHIYPGLYENTGPAIRQAVVDLQARLNEADLALQITSGADTHITPDLIAGSVSYTHLDVYKRQASSSAVNQRLF